MSSVLVSGNALITGGTFTQVNNNDGHYHRFQENSDILHRATATAAFHNSKERFDPPKCHPKTRVAILTQIMKWIRWEGDLEAFIMWVYGPAGAGKSAIAQTIAEMCEEEMILLASFFFSRNDPSRNNVNPLIATIAYQIILNIPQVRDAILGAIEHDPLIFSKSLAVQFKSLIVAPLQPLAEAGHFNQPTSRRLIIIDGLDECSDPKVQRKIVEVIANAQRQHRLPLIFLFASRPEQHISLAFSTGVLPGVTTRIALDESYLPDKDIELFLTDKFQEIKSTHWLRAYIPPQWPLPNVLTRLVRKSSGQFIYASTVICYVSSIQHKPTDRLDIVLGIRPPQRDLPFAELDALYMHILTSVENIEPVLEILSLVYLSSFTEDDGIFHLDPSLAMIEKFLSLQTGDVELYLGDLSSLVSIRSQTVIILHASLTDFFMDPTRSKELWINPPARHAAFARRCLQSLQRKENVEISFFTFNNTFHHLKNAEMTSELHDDLNNFSFNNLYIVFKNCQTHDPHSSCTIFHFVPRFLECLKELPIPEADHLCQNLQVSFDSMLCNILKEYYSFPRFTLFLGSLCQFLSPKQPYNLEEMVASLSLIREQGEGHILDDIGFSSLSNPMLPLGADGWYLAYFEKLLESPERSGTHIFDQKRYATAAKECLQLYLCSHHNFSKRATELACHDKALCRNKPSAWISRLGFYSRIRKARHHFKVEQYKSLKARLCITQHSSFPENSPEHQYCRFVTYRRALDLLPFFLERSAIYLELANVLRSCTFTTMAWKFPRRRRLAKEAIVKYLLRVESAVGKA